MNPTLLLLAALPAIAGAHELELRDERWHLAAFENPLDLSGLAASGPGTVLVGSDEMFHVQPGLMQPDKHRIESRRPIPLPVDGPIDKAEVDIEGVAFCPQTSAYYVVGSHGVGKKKADIQPDRLSFYRLPVDAETGQIREQAIDRTSLQPWLARTPAVARHLHEPLQQNGLNIEGLTARDGLLFIGLRAPNLDGDGIVLEVPANAPFEASPASLKVHRLQLGKGRGIREIAAVRDGFVIVTGNASAPATKRIPVSFAEQPDDHFELRFWDGAGTATQSIGTLPENGGKAEGLLVLEDTREHIDLLVVFDGLLGGEPLTVRVHR
ncbi:DUF3616 domain-containing protein [Haloferula sargassicola]|uniref:DUF3616 domain-containing protein n=1 Tax=Haloferula sargassicola TaxID=490096 RepID=A0ABP9UJ24_9BACT